MTKRTITANAEAERAVIGACLLSDHAIEETRRVLEPTDFIAPTNQAIYAAILRTHDSGARCDTLTVHANIEGADVTLEELHRLQNDTTFSTSNAVRHATAVADARLRFELARRAGEILDLATGQAASLDAGDAAERARELLAGLDMPTSRGAPDPDVATFTDSIHDTYDWLVPGFLERRDRLIVTGEEGAGKSYLTAQLATMAATGIHPWHLKPVPPCNVLIIDLENPKRLVGRRMHTLRQAAGAHLDPQRLRVHSRPEGIDLTTRTDRNWLIDRCQANAADLLVIGPVYRMSAGVAARGDIGGEDQARKVTAVLDDIRNRCDVALILETHAPHGESAEARHLRPFGSSVWLRWPEFGIGIRRDRQDAAERRFLLGHWRGPRDVRPWPIALTKHAGQWPWTPEMPAGTFRRTA